MAFLTCPFCGFEFAREDSLCAHGCPFGAACGLSRCPSCEYEFPEQPRGIPLIRRLWRGKRAIQADRLSAAKTVREMKPGDHATVLCVGGRKASRQNALAVFGLVPGAEIVLVQHRPACVIRIGETELALDREIALEILVESPQATLPATQSA